MLQPAETHAIAGIARGRAVAEGERRGEEALFCIDQNHDVEHRSELFDVRSCLENLIVLPVTRRDIGAKLEPRDGLVGLLVCSIGK